MACDKQMRAVYCVDQCSFKSSNQGAVQQEALETQGQRNVITCLVSFDAFDASESRGNQWCLKHPHGHIAINSLVSTRISVSSLRM